MNNVLAFAKKQWRYILTALIALIIGGNIGPSDDELSSALAKNEQIKDELVEKEEKIDSLESKNKKLEAKVKEAEPFFALSETERKNQEKEAELKAAELAKKEEAKKAEEEKAAAAKAKEEEKKEQEAAAAALAAKTKTFTAGKYVVGRDIEPGLYNATAIAGQGNFVVFGGFTGLKVNEMFGVGDQDFYNNQFNNLDLEDGDEIEINNGLKIKFQPVE